MSELIEKIRKSARLVSLPEIYFRLKELLDDPDFTMAEVALLVGHDPGMAARFLRIVNSAYYGRPARIETVAHAVSLLGARQVHDIVLAASIATAFKGLQNELMDMRKFWNRSVYCAATARQLARECKDLDSERLFLIGLLHDVGHLFMYLGIPEQSQQAILRATENNQPLFLVERELLGFDYASLAGEFMKDWRLPDSLRIPIACHVQPATALSFQPETAVLHLATVLVHTELASGEFGAGAFVVDPQAWQWTGLTVETCLSARQRACEHYGEIADSLFS